MARKKVAPYGSWKSPITADLIVENIIRLGQIVLDGADIYWLEGRPEESGRNVIVRRGSDGQTTDITPPPFNTRTRVHEYGGGAFVVDNGVVYFSNFDDQRIYRQVPGARPKPITPEGKMRYADGIIDSDRRCMICVREEHRKEGSEPINTLVSLNLESENEGRVLVFGNDFYSSPRLSPDGKFLVWLTWNHPNMPWDGTELWIGELKEDGSLERIQKVAGGINESIFQPEWSPNGVLHFISDRNGWWNLCRWCDGDIESLTEMEADFGVPQWGFGMSTYAFDSEKCIICTYSAQGIWHLASLDTVSKRLEEIEIPYTDVSCLRVLNSWVVFRAGSPSEPTSIVRLYLATRKIEVLQRSSNIAIDDGYLSLPQSIEFPAADGLTANAFFYPPKNKGYDAQPNELPPLLVISHGGPTSSTSSTLSLHIQYWTSRGVAVLDVNYGGSTGYGRAYRERLKGKWGIVDVDDCVNGALFLVGKGRVDGDRLAIKGGSAGGYTTLSALTFRDVFKAGASYYGVSDLEALAKETHKFESHYLDGLIGPYPRRRDLYRERSPVNSTHHLSSPVIFFQGLEDKVVLPNQAEMMVEAIREKGIPVSYVPFEGEQHGFRRAENIKRALESELYFYSRIFGFDIADEVEPVEIENL